MRTRVLKLLSVILSFVITISNSQIIFASQQELKLSSYTIDECSDSFCEEGELNYTKYSFEKQSAKRYYADDSSVKFYEECLEHCVDSYDDLVVYLRESMQNREKTVILYYKTSIYTSFESGIFNQFYNDALEECDSSTAGDYLRLSIDTFGGNIESVSVNEDSYYKITYEFSYYTTKAQEDEFAERVNDVLTNELNIKGNDSIDDKQKVKKIYDYITSNVKYDNEHLSDSNHVLKYSAYAALINKTAVCQGYSTLFYCMAEECGLDARIVTGISRNQNHAWNIVKLGNFYYYIDSTWDAGRILQSYYLKGTDEFPDHEIDSQFETTEFKTRYPIPKTSGFEYSGTYGNFEYTVVGSAAKITNYTGTEKNVVIPSKIGNYDVKVIGYHAFYGNDSIETLTLSEGIVYLDFEAIVSCSKLKTLNLPSTLSFSYEKFGENFQGGYSTIPYSCYALETINLAEGNTNLKMVDGIIYSADMETIFLCPAKYQKETVILPDGIVNIAPMAFQGCFDIKEIVLPDTVEYIGYCGFANTLSLKNINIPDSCQIISQYAFFGNEGISIIKIPENVQQLGYGVFDQCYSLSSVIIPASVGSVENILVTTTEATVYCDEGSAAFDAALKYDWKKKLISDFKCVGGHNFKYILSADGNTYKEVCKDCGDTNALAHNIIAADTVINLKSEVFQYTGKYITPEIENVIWGDRMLIEGVDYDVSYLNNINVGIGTVVINGINAFVGTVKCDFFITKNLSAPQSVKAKLYGYDDVKVSWSKVSNAKAYKVYYKVSGGSYKFKVITTDTSCNFTNLSDGKNYYFKVVPCGYINGSYIEDNNYKTCNIYTLKKISKPTVKKSSSKKVKISWSNIQGESGYQISQHTSKSKTKIVLTYSTTSGKSKTIKASKGKTYYYKVRAYKVVDGKKIYGPWSSVRKYKL